VDFPMTPLSSSSCAAAPSATSPPPRSRSALSTPSVCRARQPCSVKGSGLAVSRPIRRPDRYHRTRARFLRRRPDQRAARSFGPTMSTTTRRQNPDRSHARPSAEKVSHSSSLWCATRSSDPLSAASRRGLGGGPGRSRQGASHPPLARWTGGPGPAWQAPPCSSWSCGDARLTYRTDPGGLSLPGGAEPAAGRPRPRTGVGAHHVARPRPETSSPNCWPYPTGGALAVVPLRVPPRATRAAAPPSLVRRPISTRLRVPFPPAP